MRLRFVIAIVMVLQFIANRAAALPTVIATGQYTDRFLPTLTDTVIPPGENIQVYALIETTDPEGSATIAVTAKQGDSILTLNHFESLSAPPNLYWGFVNFDPSLIGAWEITPTDSTGTGPSAFTYALSEPELLPFVESITPQGSPVGASVEWTLPDLTGFDIDSVHVRIVQVTPREEVFSSDDLPVYTTRFEPPSGVFQYGVEYVYGISLFDAEGSQGENRSAAQSQRFHYALPGDYNASGVVEQADLDLVLLNWGADAATVPDTWTIDPPSGNVDQDELDKVLLNWGTTPAAHGAAAVPEPNTLAILLAVAGLSLRLSRDGRPRMV
jgi:hypothetical protein